MRRSLSAMCLMLVLLLGACGGGGPATSGQDGGAAQDGGPALDGGGTTSDGGGADGGVSRARLLLDVLLQALNGTRTLTPDEFRQYFSAAIATPQNMARFGDIVEDFVAEYAPASVDRVLSEDATEIAAAVSTSQQVLLRVKVALTPETTARIADFSWNVAVDLDPARSPPQRANELWLTGYDQELRTRLPGARIELLRQSNGMPFTPSVTGVTNAYGFVRLTLPEDVSVAMRVTHPDDGTITDVYYSSFARRGNFASAFAYSDASFPAGVNRSRAQLRGRASHISAPPRRFSEVGCATVTSNGAGAVRFLNIDEDVRAGATSTDPNFAGFRIDDIAETSLTLTTTIGTDTVAVTVPNIVPGHFIQVLPSFDAPAIASNPTPRSCYTELPLVACSQESSIRSTNPQGNTVVRFSNRSTTTTYSLYWLNYQGQRVLYDTVAPGADSFQQTYVGHPWLVQANGGACQGIYRPATTGGLVELN